MSKADSPRPTLNRRGLLVGAGGIAAAAAGSVPALAAASPTQDGLCPSLEFARWRAAAERFTAANAALGQIYDARVKRHVGHLFPDYDVALAAYFSGNHETAAFFEAWLAEGPDPIEAEVNAVENEMDSAANVIRARPIRSWQDVAELAEMVRHEHGPENLVGTEADDLDVSDLKLVFAAIAKMAGNNGAPAAMAAVPTFAAPQRLSAEFRQWYALAKRLPAVLEAEEAWEKAHPTTNRVADRSSPYCKHNDSLHALEQVILQRPVSSWQDVAEIGMLALYWSDKKSNVDSNAVHYPFVLGQDPELETEYLGDRPGAYLIQAAAKMAMVGT